MSAFYNEIDPYAAQWLRNLIEAGQIAPGVVDERDIRDIRPDELAGFTQAHFFAGLGGWSRALRLAGWPDDRPVWTGSTPCQPFSAAGKGGGFDDERHLWPAFEWLIGQCRPPVIFGEQVASKDGLEWLDLVQADLEGAGYTFGAGDMCAAGIGAPHIRQRLWFVADANSQAESGWRIQRPGEGDSTGAGAARERFAGLCADGLLAGAMHPGRPERRPVAGDGSVAGGGEFVGLGYHHHQGLPARERAAVVGEGRRHEGRATEQPGGASGGVADPKLQPGCAQHERQSRPRSAEERGDSAEPWRNGEICRPGPVNGFWADADWLLCRDGKWRPVEPGTFPLLDGLSASLDRLRAIEAAAWEAIADYGTACGIDAREVLRMVRQKIHPATGGQEQPVGVREQFSSPPLLLAFLLCVETARNGPADCCGFKEAGAEVRERILRGVRPHGTPGRTPCERQPAGQSNEQSADALLVLSLVLARAATAYRAEARKAHAASARVGMLRAYGNAIVPQVAAEWIGAYLDREVFD